METPWCRPIVLKCNVTREEITIGGPRDAIIFLAHRWLREPDEKGYLKAMQVCAEALGRPDAAVRARGAVMAALKEAGFLFDNDGSVHFPSAVVQPAGHHSYRMER